MHGTSNQHGEWLIRGSAEHRANLEKIIGHKLADDDERVTRKSGPPDPDIPQCTYCGSIHPADFVKFCQRSDVAMEVADWKYGWPHKIYVTVPNPKPDELRACGSTSVGSKPQYDTDGRLTHYIKTQETAPEGFPAWNDQRGWTYLSAYPTLTLKFYTTHLSEFPELAQFALLIFKRVGVWFEVREGRLYYRTVPAASASGSSAGS